MKIFQAFSFLILALSSTPLLHAQSGDDDCISATAIYGVGEWDWNNTLATTDGPYCNNGQAWWDIWWNWRAPRDGYYEVETCDLTTNNTVLHVYEGWQCPPTDDVVCNDDACGYQSYGMFWANDGESFKIRLGTGNPIFWQPGSGSIAIRAMVPNDFCDQPTSISGVGSWTVDLSLAIGDTPPAGCPMWWDVWYHWTPPAAGSYVVSTCGLTTVETAMAMYPDLDCGTAFQVCSDSGCGLQSRMEFSVSDLNPVRLQIGSAVGDFGGITEFEIAHQTPPNDDCGTAEPIHGEGMFPFTTRGATTDGVSEDSCGLTGDTNIYEDVWFRWLPSASGTYTISTCSGDFDSRIALYQGESCATSAPLGCDDDSCSGTGAVLNLDVAGGTPYLIRVGSTVLGGIGAGTLDVTLVTPSVTSLGSPYCLSGANTEHAGGAIMRAFGSTSLADDAFALSASDVPVNKPGLFYYGENQVFLPFGEGYRCVGGNTSRLPPIFSNTLGEATYPIDFEVPLAVLEIVAGSVWNFQFWYRDPMGGPNGFNLTNGLELHFVP